VLSVSEAKQQVGLPYWLGHSALLRAISSSPEPQGREGDREAVPRNHISLSL